MPKRIGAERCYLRDRADACAQSCARVARRALTACRPPAGPCAFPNRWFIPMSLPSLIPLARRGSPLAAVALSCALLPSPAPAAVPGANQAITVTSNTSDVLLAGFANNAAVTVVRDGVTIAKGVNKNDPAAAPPEGGVNSVHLLGIAGCWTKFTPQLLPGDTIKVGTDSTVIRDVTAQAPVVEG